MLRAATPPIATAAAAPDSPRSHPREAFPPRRAGPPGPREDPPRGRACTVASVGPDEGCADAGGTGGAGDTGDTGDVVADDGDRWACSTARLAVMRSTRSAGIGPGSGSVASSCCTPVGSSSPEGCRREIGRVTIHTFEWPVARCRISQSRRMVDGRRCRQPIRRPAQPGGSLSRPRARPIVQAVSGRCPRHCPVHGLGAPGATRPGVARVRAGGRAPARSVRGRSAT